MNKGDTIILTSSAFFEGGHIPVEYTGYGADDSPPLGFEGIPSETKSLAVTMVDLDVPFFFEYPHWLMWNLPPVTEIPRAIPKGEMIEWPLSAVQGLAYGKHEYKGPKPPRFIRGAHRYVFTVYALDTVLDIGASSKKRDLLEAVSGQVLGKGSLMGIYQNGR